MAALTRRTQILLDEDRYQRLRARAALSHSSVGALVREAIDRVILDEDDERTSAGAAFLSADPMEVGDPIELEQELDGVLDREHRQRSG